MLENLDQLLESIARHTSLGHSKRDGAFLRQVENLCTHPGGTGAGTSNSNCAAMSAYRFASNDAVDLSSLRETRLATALEACPEDETLLVINDASVLDYYRHDSKSDRRAVGDGKGKGYEYICNLGVALESERPVGVLHDCLISAGGPDDGDMIAYHDDPHFGKLSKTEASRLECNHRHILNCHVKHIAGHASGRPVVLVADREFDDHFLFETCLSGETAFVIRSKANRNVQIRADLDWLPKNRETIRYPGLPLLPDHICIGMQALVENVPTVPYKSIPLDARGRLTDEKSGKEHVDVSVGTFSITLYRKAKRNKKYLDPRDYVPLNVVVVKESNPPRDRDPIQWVLYTSLEIDTPEKIRKIVRIYELRWLIECLFKYLKSGFKLEDLRYDSARKTAIHLVAATIAVTFLIGLKKDAGLPCSDSRLSPEDYEKVKQAAKNPDDPEIPEDLRFFALVATKGGWRGRKLDPISPMTLIRGFSRLVDAIELIQNAETLIKYAAEKFAKK